MTIDHGSVPRPGRPLPSSRRTAAAVLDRPARTSQTRASAAVGRHRRAIRSRIAVPTGLLTVDTLAVCTATGLTTDRSGQPLLGAVAVLPLLLPLNLTAGLYRTRLTVSALDELPALATRATVALAFAVILSTCLAGPPDAAATHPLRLLATLATLILSAAGGRALVYRLLRRARRRRPSPTLVLGTGHLGQRVAAALIEHREYGLRPIGYLDTTPAPLAPDAELPVLGGHEALEREIRRHRIHHVLATEGTTDQTETTTALREATRLGCQVWLIPTLREYGSLTSPDHDELWGLPCLKLGRPAPRRHNWPIKRALDITAATLGLITLAPLLTACALAVRLDTGPGILFRQQRTGLNGKTFTLLKFRTLRPTNEHESATRWNISHDHRMGNVGRLLRRTSLDELPQLWNVLRGDMSLVGPRPERPYFVMRFAQAYPGYADRHRVPVGLTGLAQINGLRGDTSIEDRARFDNRYIEGWSLWQDTKILLRTAVLLLNPDGS